MPLLPPAQIKKTLVAAGFQVFRTLPEEIVLAERVRENLIMDSGVRLRVTEPLEIRVVFRAQRGAFPGEDEPVLFGRARSLADGAVARGFLETGTHVSTMKDPSDADRVLDLVYEVIVAKPVESVEKAIEELRFVLSLERLAEPKEERA